MIPLPYPILCKEVSNGAIWLVDSLSKALCARALSADAEGVLEKADSDDRAPILPMRVTREFCAKLRALETPATPVDSF
jgi:hypothetical protein